LGCAAALHLGAALDRARDGFAALDDRAAFRRARLADAAPRRLAHLTDGAGEPAAFPQLSTAERRAGFLDRAAAHPSGAHDRAAGLFTERAQRSGIGLAAAAGGFGNRLPAAGDRTARPLGALGNRAGVDARLRPLGAGRALAHGMRVGKLDRHQNLGRNGVNLDSAEPAPPRMVPSAPDCAALAAALPICAACARARPSNLVAAAVVRLV
jgi:hypothetical protein